MGQFNLYTLASTIDGTNDLFLKYENSTGVLKTISRNTIMGVSGQPADISSTQSFTNKTIGNTNAITVKDGSYTLQNSSDTTKQAVFSLSGITTGNTRTLTVPDASGTLPLLGSTQTWTGANTFSGSTWSGGTISNPTLSVDTVSGYTTSNSGNIYGVAITTGQISGSSTVLPAALVTGVPTTKLYNACKFSVYLAGTVTQQDTLTTINLDTKIFDTGTNFSTSTHLFTAPVAGFYQFNAAFSIIQDSGTGYAIQLLKNGSVLVAQGTSYLSGTTNAFNIACIVSSLVQLSANDTIAVQAIGANALRSYSTGINQTYFNGYLVSVT